MRYTYFEFENFKGIKTARLELTPRGSTARVHTLVGLNESGKTTVLEAIDHFQGTDVEEVQPKQLGELEALPPHTLIPIAERSNFNGEVRVRCGVELDDADIAAAATHLRENSDGYRLTDLAREIRITDHYVYENSRFSRRMSRWQGMTGTGRTKAGRVLRPLDWTADRPRWLLLAEVLRARLPSIWYFPNFLFDVPDRIYIEPHDGESDTNRFYRELFQDVLGALDRDLTVEQHVIERYRSGTPADESNLRQVLLEVSTHVTRTVVASWNQIFRDKPLSQKRVTIEISQDKPSDDGARAGRLWVQFRIEDANELFSIGERSLGFRWFFVYLMLTTYRGRRKDTDENMLYLFDEPASNLHPTAQKTLLASLAELTEKAVVVYTTHSHHLIEPAWLGTTSIVANEGLGDEAIATEFTARRTDIRITPYKRFAAQHPEQSHYFQPILDVLDYAPSAIELVPEVVLVEGKSDFYLLKYFEDIVLARSSEEQLNYTPGGGAGTLDDLIQLYIGWSRPFVALLDGDAEGRQQRKRYLDKFGLVVKPHLSLLSEVAGRPDAKGIETLLTAEDHLAFQRVVAPDAVKPHKKTLALGVQEALVTRQSVALSQEARANLGTIVDALRERLAELASSALVA